MKLDHVLALVSLTLVCLMTDCCLEHVFSAGECTFLYVGQPPSTTMQDCDPYFTYDNLLNYIWIRLVCIVRTHNDLRGMFEIRWFKENSTEEVVDLGLGNVQEIHTNMTLETKSRYHDYRFFNHAYNLSFLGKYWCQVINTTADPDQPLMRSNVFTLLPPDNYTGSSCATSQFINKTTCADLSDSKQSSIPSSTAMNQASSTITTAHSSTATKPSEKEPTIVAATVSGLILLTLLVIVICSTLTVLVMKKRRDIDENTLHITPGSTKIKISDDNAATPQFSASSNTEKEALNTKTMVYTELFANKTRNFNKNDEQDMSKEEQVLYELPYYQQLDSVTTDYTSMYTTPTSVGGPHLVEMDEKMYSIVNQIGREECTYMSTTPHKSTCT